MNFHTLVDSFTFDELNMISSLIFERRKVLAREYCETLNQHEQKLLSVGGYIDAIKAYRQRTGQSLVISKTAVDMFRDSIPVTPKE